ncbi:ABC transporter permease [Colwellia sp. D2M02]|uniref:ABC transporter permease n=1 Tax=Colwellia asteriadis TaxID=517723 RepID=A0ABN1L5Q7_9GAMM|nr:ABC transporter permease [Colwellia sp. D2M02]MBU2894805.1 ABC transporter permease [Colwellia sp. D2M02]
MFLRIATKSLLNRKGSVLLTLLAMTISILVMFGVEHIRTQAKTSFANTISGVDLIVGTRTGSLNLLLYSVFRMGSPTNNISWEAFTKISTDERVAWTIPISLGDSHKGYRVLGTNQSYFTHFKYGDQQPLTFNNGKPFEHIFDVVLGADIAKKLGYKLGDKITLAHGLVSTSFSNHDDTPFTIVGILQATGTPVDQTLHISLKGLDALHVNWQHQTAPTSITALMVGLKSKMSTFTVQRNINTSKDEPLLAILPGVAIAELWQTMAILENVLRLISLFVFISAIIGLSAMMLSSIRERDQEIKLLRAIGASSFFLYCFIKLEAMMITLLSTSIAVILLYLFLLMTKPYLVDNFGLALSENIMAIINIQWLAMIFICTFIAAIPAAFIAFKRAKC